MAFCQSTLLVVAVFAILATFRNAVQVEAVPVDTAASAEAVNTAPTVREERFYGYPVGGVAGSSANAFAASNSFGLGGGLGISSSQAAASASSGAHGLGFYGK